MEKYIYANELKHFGRKGMKWYQNVYSKETVNAKKQAGESEEDVIKDLRNSLAKRKNASKEEMDLINDLSDSLASRKKGSSEYASPNEKASDQDPIKVLSDSLASRKKGDSEYISPSEKATIESVHQNQSQTKTSAKFSVEKVPNKVKRNVDGFVTNIERDKALASRNRLTRYLNTRHDKLTIDQKSRNITHIKGRTGKEKLFAAVGTAAILAASLGPALMKNYQYSQYKRSTNATKGFNDAYKKYATGL